MFETVAEAVAVAVAVAVALVYTDGSCKGDRRGGYGALVIYPDGTDAQLYGGERETTNNRMELRGAIEALRSLPAGLGARVHSDSRYVLGGMTGWLQGWLARDWKTAAGAPVKNADLWRDLAAAARGREVEWIWVKGHSGNEGNDRADALANLGAAEQRGDVVLRK
jgi:ribonuclease HI